MSDLCQLRFQGFRRRHDTLNGRSAACGEGRVWNYADIRHQRSARMNHEIAGHKEVPRFDLTFFKTIRFHIHGLDAATVENVKPAGPGRRLRREGPTKQSAETSV